jgi:hypothetical protein
MLLDKGLVLGIGTLWRFFARHRITPPPRKKSSRT